VKWTWCTVSDLEKAQAGIQLKLLAFTVLISPRGFSRATLGLLRFNKLAQDSASVILVRPKLPERFASEVIPNIACVLHAARVASLCSFALAKQMLAWAIPS